MYVSFVVLRYLVTNFGYPPFTAAGTIRAVNWPSDMKINDSDSKIRYFGYFMTYNARYLM